MDEFAVPNNEFADDSGPVRKISNIGSGAASSNLISKVSEEGAKIIRLEKEEA